MRKHLLVSFLVLALLIYASLSHAFTNLDLMGNYSLISFTIREGGQPTITQNDLSSFTGRASVSNNAFLLEMSGTLKLNLGGRYVWQWKTGFYTVVSGNRIMVTLTGEGTTYVDINYSDSTLTASGYDSDHGFHYTYVFQKTEMLFTEFQLNQLIAAKNAVIDNQAENIEDLNTLIAQQDQRIESLSLQIESMFTQAQLDQALADANETKALIIAEKDEIIESMFTPEELEIAVAAGITDYKLDGNGKLDLADIIFGLQILTGMR